MGFDFVSEYIDYHNSLTDGSVKYARAIAYTLLGFACGRNSYISLTPREVYCNFFTLILGDSTVSRKTTAMYDVGLPIIDEDDVLPNNYSPESLYDQYAANPHRILLEAEFSKILKKAKRKNSYMSHIVEDFEQIYDCPNSFKSDTRGHREVIARNLYMSIITATTPAALQENLTQEMLQGGFYPRFFVIWEKNPNPQPRRELPDGVEEKRLALTVYLKKLRCSNYRFDFQPKEALHSWQQGVMRNDPDATSIIGRYEGYIIKISSLKALNDWVRQNDFTEEVNNLAGSGSLDAHIQQIIENDKRGVTDPSSDPQVISVTHEEFIHARDWVQEVLEDSKELRSLISEEKILSKLYRVMRGKHKVRHSDFLRKTGLKARDFKEGINTLVDQRRLCKTPEDRIMYYCVAERSRCSQCGVTNQSVEYVTDTDGDQEETVL